MVDLGPDLSTLTMAEKLHAHLLDRAAQYPLAQVQGGPADTKARVEVAVGALPMSGVLVLLEAQKSLLKSSQKT